MEKDQPISMIHFLVKREDKRAQEVQELKDMIREHKDTHNEDMASLVEKLLPKVVVFKVGRQN